MIIWNLSLTGLAVFRECSSFPVLPCSAPLPPSQQNSFREIDCVSNPLETVPRNFFFNVAVRLTCVCIYNDNQG